jgi:hypothetical protein
MLKRVFGELEWKPREVQIDQFLLASNSINAFKTVQENVSLNLEKNNKIIITQIQIILSSHPRLKERINPFLGEELNDMNLKASIEHIFKVFYELLAEKGLITMSGNKENQNMSNETIQKLPKLKSVLSKKKKSNQKSLNESKSKNSNKHNIEGEITSDLERQRREICFGASRELKNILSQSEMPRQRTFTEFSKVEKKQNESILLTGKEKRKLNVNKSRENSREVVNDSISERKSALNTSMKVMNLSKNLSITDSMGGNSQFIGMSIANNKNSYINGRDQNKHYIGLYWK